MAERAVAVLAMSPVLTADMWTPEHRERLAACCDVPDAEPLARLRRAARGVPAGARRDPAYGLGLRTRSTRAVLERAPRLRAVVHAAGTVKNLVTPDLLRARRPRHRRRRPPTRCPWPSTRWPPSCFAGKRVFRLQRRYAELRGFRFWPQEIPDLGNLDKVVGIVGASRIGRRVIELLRPFDFELLVHDPYLSDARGASARRREAGRPGRCCCAARDVVSLHAPALPETRHMLDARRLALLRDGAVLVNTARGALVDHDGADRELVSGRIDAVIDTTRARGAARGLAALRAAERLPHAARGGRHGSRDPPPGGPGPRRDRAPRARRAACATRCAPKTGTASHDAARLLLDLGPRPLRSPTPRGSRRRAVCDGVEVTDRAAAPRAGRLPRRRARRGRGGARRRDRGGRLRLLPGAHGRAHARARARARSRSPPRSARRCCACGPSRTTARSTPASATRSPLLHGDLRRGGRARHRRWWWSATWAPSPTRPSGSIASSPRWRARTWP